MNDSVIICLTGESGSGKSVIENLFKKKGYKNIMSYTTRKKRYPDESGHIFIELSEKDKAVQKLKTGDFDDLAYMDYFDGEWYWSTKSQHKGEKKIVYAINPNGIRSLKKNLPDEKIIVIYVNCDKNRRRERMIERLEKNDRFDKDLSIYEFSINQRSEYENDEYMIVESNYIINNNGDFLETTKVVEELINKIELANKVS